MRSTNNPKLLKILDRELGLDRTAQGHIHAIDRTCIHRGAALAQGWIENDWIVCPDRGDRFKASLIGLDGTCPDRSSDYC
jgi:phenylpropionate dioxygenase-like ring-hydroxylating dioxygenase large terminal subunit